MSTWSPSHSVVRVGALWLLMVLGCSSFPAPEQKKFGFPKNSAFVGDIQRPYQTLGLVRARVEFQTLDPHSEESDLCRNYYNKAVRQLVEMARKKGADAVIDVKSVVFFEDGHFETFATPECSDDGLEGQALAQGIAVKWKKPF